MAIRGLKDDFLSMPRGPMAGGGEVVGGEVVNRPLDGGVAVEPRPMAIEHGARRRAGTDVSMPARRALADGLRAYAEVATEALGRSTRGRGCCA